MGGLGSGQWHRWRGRKRTVEESPVVAMGAFRSRLFQGAVGVLTWTWGDGKTFSAGYLVQMICDTPTVTLFYRWRDTEDVSVTVGSEATPTPFGGRRWWFNCPFYVRGRPCNRRAGKLYLPPGARDFGCRTCHALTYRSTQEAHQLERNYRRLMSYSTSPWLLPLW